MINSTAVSLSSTNMVPGISQIGRSSVRTFTYHERESSNSYFHEIILRSLGPLSLSYLLWKMSFYQLQSAGACKPALFSGALGEMGSLEKEPSDFNKVSGWNFITEATLTYSQSLTSKAMYLYSKFCFVTSDPHVDKACIAPDRAWEVSKPKMRNFTHLNMECLEVHWLAEKEFSGVVSKRHGKAFIQKYTLKEVVCGP